MNPKIIIDDNMQETNAVDSYSFPICLLHIVQSDYPSGSFYAHWHSEIEMAYVVAGQMQWQVNDQVFRLQKGDCCVINQNAIHSGSILPGMDCIYIAINFSPILISGYANSAVDHKYVQPILNAPSFSYCIFTGETPEHAEMAKLVAELEEYYTSRPSFHELYVESILEQMWILIFQKYDIFCRSQTGLSANNAIPHVKQVLSFIYEHYNETITLDDMASVCHTSKSEFCRLFKASMRQTPFNYLLQYRIQKSLSLLCSPEHSITEIASQVGFNGSSYYAETFRRFMRCTPTEYRKRNLSAHRTG